MRKGRGRARQGEAGQDKGSCSHLRLSGCLHIGFWGDSAFTGEIICLQSGSDRFSIFSDASASFALHESAWSH